MLDGIWEPIEAEMGGAKLPGGILEGMKLTIRGDTYDARVGGQTDRGTLRLDPSKGPREMDVVGAEGPNAGRTIPAIYELAGDSLRVCYSLAGPPRPERFETGAGPHLFLVRYRRTGP